MPRRQRATDGSWPLLRSKVGIRRAAVPDAAKAVRRDRGPSLRRPSHRGNQTFDVARDAVADPEHGCSVTRRAKTREIRLREALVLAMERLGHRNVGDRPIAGQLVERARRIARKAAARVDRRVRDGIERRRVAGAEVEDARALATIVEVEIRRDDVVDMDEIASLLAIRISAGALEQAHAAIAPVLQEEVIRD